MNFNDRDLQLIYEALYVTLHFYRFFQLFSPRVDRMSDLKKRIEEFCSHDDSDLPF